MIRLLLNYIRFLNITRMDRGKIQAYINIKGRLGYKTIQRVLK